MRASTLSIAWRNLGRSKRRTLLAIGAIALGQLTLVFVNGMMAGSFDDMLRTITGPLVGHVQIHHKDWPEERAIDLYVDGLSEVEAEIEALPGVETVSPRIFSFALAASRGERDAPADAEPAMILGIDVVAESQRGGLLEGSTPGLLAESRSVALGSVLADRLKVRAGETIALISQDVDGFPVSDIFKVKVIVRPKVEVAKNMGVLMAIEDAGEFLAMRDQAHEITVQGDDQENSAELAQAISSLPAIAGMEILTWRQAVPGLARIMDMKNWIDMIFLGIVFVAAAAGIANTATMSTFERTHEFGMLLAVGCRPVRLVRMVLVESVILGLVGVAVGSIMGTALVLLTSHTGIDYALLAGNAPPDMDFGGMSISYVLYPRFELRHILFGVCAVTITSILASAWPAALVARLQPVEAMRS